MERVPLKGFNTETDYYVTEPSEVVNFKPDVNVIANRKYLKYILGVRYEEDKYLPPIASEWYPRCNSYYPYTEDVDAINRVDHLRAAKKFLESFTTIKTDNKSDFDPYSENDAELKYLQSSPTTFLILGKPGIGEEDLGKLLADYWQCVYIDPEILITEEIESRSRAGQCIEFNLRCGRAIAIDVILRLLEKRLKSKSTAHRGYVICGFPLIRNDMFQEDPVSSESAVFTAQDIFDEIMDHVESSSQIVRNVSQMSQASDVEEEGDQDNKVAIDAESVEVEVETAPLPPDIGSTTSQMCKMLDISSNYAAQANFLFNLCHEPLIIIYLMCPNFDVVTKHEHYRYNMKTDEIIDLLKDQGENIVYTIFTKSPGFDTENLPEDTPNVPEITEKLSPSDTNYLIYLPKNFSGNIQKQLEDYRYLTLPTFEKHVLLHDPQYFIKVDGRLSPKRMFEIVKTRLRVLPIPNVVIPEKIIDPIIPTGGEGGVVETVDYESKSPQECYEQLRRKKIIGKMYKLKWSRWGATCPVAMKEGSHVPGRAQFAVKFMNKIWFLSDENAMTKFIRNPRPFLLPPYPRSICKIFIIGPSSSGKSAVAKCLALLLDGEVLDTFTLQIQHSERKNKEYEEKLRNDAMNEGLLILQKQRQEEYERKMKEREEAIAAWSEQALKAVADRVMLERSMRAGSMRGSQITSFPLKSLKEISAQTSFSKYEEKLEQIKIKMDELEIFTLYDDLSKCEEITDENSIIMSFLPKSLTEVIPKPEAASIFDEFVSNYANEKVENRPRLNFDTIEDSVEMYLTAIRNTEEKNKAANLYHGGWIVDGMIPEPEILDMVMEEFYPNDLFIFKDTSRKFLQERYKVRDQNIYKDYYTFFENIGKPEIAVKSPSLTSTFSYKARLAREVIDNVLANKIIMEEDAISDNEEELPFRGDDTDEFIDEDYFLTHPTRLQKLHYEILLREYDDKLDILLAFLEDRGVAYYTVDLADKSIEELMKYVIKQIDSRYQFRAHQMTPEDRTGEVDDYGEPVLAGEDIEEEEATASPDGSDSFVKNRRLGVTSIYCPVTYSNHWVLWKGKEEFAVKYNDYTYLLATEKSMTDFIKDPLEYVLTKPPERLPPPRICIAGIPGSGKTVLARALHRHLGLYYLCYDNLLKRVFNMENDSRELGVLLTYAEEDSPEVLIVQNYLDKDEPLSEEVRKVLDIRKLWYDEPMRSTGFVFDAFPRRPSDFPYMEANTLIPDIVLQLSCTSIEVSRRRVQKLLADWKTVKERQQKEREAAYLVDLKNWQVARKARIDELMETKRQERYQTKIQELKVTPLSTVEEVNEEEEDRLTTRSQISYNSVAEAADMEEITKTVDEEYPEPQLVVDQETEDQALERFIELAKHEYTVFSDYFRILKESCESELIEWVSLDADLSEEKVIDQALRAVDKIKFRNRSAIERCYEITVEVAEQLIASGYYFLSRFGKACPVQLHDTENPMHMFLPLEQKPEIFPMIHGYFIYFLAGVSNKEKFLKHPLKYIYDTNADFPIIPFRVAVIGPPKSGKTALAERFKRDFGMRCISIGQAARYVLRNLPYSKLAKDMEAVLRNGWELTSEMTMKCVEAMAFDGRGQTQGLVFDGFPNSKYDVMHLAEIGLIPHLVFFLDADEDDIEEYRRSDKGKRGLPVFSKSFIGHRLEVWQSSVDTFTDWFDKEYQVYTKLKVKNCKWGIWDAAYKIALDVLYEIKSYFKHCPREMGLHIANMQVTPVEFQKRQSCFKHYCPLCLHYDNLLINGSLPPDRTGLVQYKEFFYWICRKHLKEFADDPTMFLSPYTRSLPADLPEAVRLKSRPDNLYEDGLCVVCYWNGQPWRVLNKGKLEYACLFREVYYIFDCKACLEIFMADPFTYFQKRIHFKGNQLADADLNNLPIQGYLEQYIIRDVVKAVTNTGTIRPVVAGLGIERSAAINIGLFLKLHNENLTEETRTMYEKAYKMFTDRRLNFIDHLARMKRTINPYLHYEEPLEPLVYPDSEKREESTEPPTPGSDEKFGSLLQEILQYMQLGG